jgi:hypothetical protein
MHFYAIISHLPTGHWKWLKRYSDSDCPALRYSSATIDVKTGSPDPGDFAKTRRLLPRLWHISLSRLYMPRSYKQWCELPTFAILFFARTATSLWSIFRGSGSLRNGCATLAYRSRHRRRVLNRKKGPRPLVQFILKAVVGEYTCIYRTL